MKAGGDGDGVLLKEGVGEMVMWVQIKMKMKRRRYKSDEGG